MLGKHSTNRPISPFPDLSIIIVLAEKASVGHYPPTRHHQSKGGKAVLAIGYLQFYPLKFLFTLDFMDLKVGNCLS